MFPWCAGCAFTSPACTVNLITKSEHHWLIVNLPATGAAQSFLQLLPSLPVPRLYQDTVTVLQVPNVIFLFVELQGTRVSLFLQAVEIALKGSPAYPLIMTVWLYYWAWIRLHPMLSSTLPMNMLKSIRSSIKPWGPTSLNRCHLNINELTFKVPLNEPVFHPLCSPQIQSLPSLRISSSPYLPHFFQFLLQIWKSTLKAK